MRRGQAGRENVGFGRRARGSQAKNSDPSMSAAIQIHAPETEVRVAMRFIGAQARAAARVLANASAEQKNRALTTAARSCGNV